MRSDEQEIFRVSIKAQCRPQHNYIFNVPPGCRFSLRMIALVMGEKRSRVKEGPKSQMVFFFFWLNTTAGVSNG